MRTRRSRVRRLASLKYPKISFSWICTIIYTVSLILLITGSTFRLKKYTCSTSSFEQCPDFIIPELQKHSDELLYLIQTTDIEDTLIKNIPKADYIDVKQVWPDLLQAKIIWQHPIVNLSIPASDSALLVGNNGQILDVVNESDPTLPTIIASTAADLIISDRINEPSLQAAFEIVTHMSKANINTDLINVQSAQHIEVKLDNGKIAVFTSLKPISTQVHTLQLILSQATINPGLYIIDLRLDRPALKSTL